MPQKNDIFDLEKLNAFALEMLEAADLDDLLWSISNNVGNTLGFEDCVIYLREGQVLVQMAAYGIKSAAAREVFERIEIPVGKGIVGTVAETGKAEIVQDTEADERYIFDQFSGLSELAVPVIYEGETIGVIDVEASAKNSFSEADKERLQIIANIAASRIASAKYYRSLQETQVKLKKSHEELEMKILDLARNQQSLIQSEKMASVGQLAAGVAHEINNPLGFSLSNLATLKEYVTEIRSMLQDIVNNPLLPRSIKASISNHRFEFMMTDIVELTDETIEGLTSAKDIVADLCGFARSEGDEFSVADLNEGICATLNVLRNELKYHCEIETSLGKIPPIDCNIGKLNQVFANIILNARQACEDSGLIKIRTRLDGQLATIEIENNGPRISDEHIAHIFTPFYTTKPVGEGTGLGLSICYQIIVEEHRGNLEVDSNTERTVFKISLPIAQK